MRESATFPTRQEARAWVGGHVALELFFRAALDEHEPRDRAVIDGKPPVELVLPDFRYRAVDASGIVENEVCPVFRAVTDDLPAPADDEVAEYAWVSEDSLRAAVAGAPFGWSPWLGWQLTELEAAGLHITR